MNTASLQLHGPTGPIATVADLVISDPVDEQGLVYRNVALTIPFVNSPQVGISLKVLDSGSGKTVCSFVAERVLMQFENERFLKISGRIYLAFPKAG